MKFVLIVFCVSAATAVAAESDAITDPKKAGPDYQIQGEYLGESPQGHKVGAQVVAEGDGRFSVRFLPGGLPGAGWNGQDTKVTAKTENGQVTFVPNVSNKPSTGEIAGGKLTMRNAAKTMSLDRTVRHSPTEGEKPPAGAIILFDGSNADEWDHGKIENGLLSVSVPGGQTSKQRFRDCTIHVEFILPFMPKARGQGRANSGVYVNGRYEVQVLDSFGLEGKDNECGGIYSLLAPTVNMCYPPLQWQTYDIDFTAPRFADGKKTENARITVKQNGVLIHNNVELKKLTPGNLLPDDAEPGPIHLQNHGNPVFYRNVWVLKK